ncbi:MAG: N-acetylglucosamine-6-phosphate deacetylase [Acidimicrobiia bacterium]|nr:N-acetylglucosamine-6-phosphate deacetylase [Acidimicrobiia bacterium]
MRLGVGRAIVEGTSVAGDVEIEDGTITAVGLSGGGSGLAAPGFVDIQINGFAGIDFAAARPDDYSAVGRALAATGVTAYQPTLITLPEEVTIATLQALGSHSPAGPAPHIIGMHLEGPFLSPHRAGAHDAASMHDPDPALAERLIRAGPVTMVTVAPERPGALDLIELFQDRGIVVSCGHSDATAAEAHAAFDLGARTVTHLFSAHPPFHHRKPGLAGAALSRPDVTASIILDGFHLADEVVKIACSAPASIALITDAISAAGLGEGAYPLGDRTVHVSGGAARLENGTLAGSVLTMDRAVRNLVEIGIGLESAIHAATAVPARVMGRSDLGTLRVGGPADLVVLDDRLEPVRTLVGGHELFSAR